MVQNNDDLILAIQAAALNVAVTVFTSRRLVKSCLNPKKIFYSIELDGSDAFDTLYIGCEKFPQADTSNVAVDVNGIV